MPFINSINGTKTIEEKTMSSSDEQILSSIISRSATEIVLPNTITSIGDNIFSYCTLLTNITIPNTITTIGDSAFSYCSSLTSITIPSSVTSMGNSVFNRCTKLTSITINKAKDSISGSPWGATSATVTWNG